MQSYYILSLTHSEPKNDLLVWWRPNNAGYCTRLDWVGEYSEAEVKANLKYYNNGIDTLAVPVNQALGSSVRVVINEPERIKKWKDEFLG